MSLVGFRAKGHPQQTKYAGSSRHVDDRALPADDFAKLNKRFEFTVDVAELIVLLLPANRTEQGWWQRQIEPMRDRALSPLVTEFLPGRLRFLKPGQTVIGPNERPPFGIVLCIWEWGGTCKGRMV